MDIEDVEMFIPGSFNVSSISNLYNPNRSKRRALLTNDSAGVSSTEVVLYKSAAPRLYLSPRTAQAAAYRQFTKLRNELQFERHVSRLVVV